MFGLVTLLSEPHKRVVYHFTNKLMDECGFEGVKMIPHFSWQIAESYDLPKADQILSDQVYQFPQFVVKTTGLGVFTGDDPVVYIALVKDRQLLDMHQHLWEIMLYHSSGVTPNYSPEQWMPHITIAYGNINRETMGCISEEMAFKQIRWEITVDNLALISQEADFEADIVNEYQLSGEN
jgi:2'-5' RNA ligase